MRDMTKKIISAIVSSALVMTSVCVPSIHSQASSGPIEKNTYDSGKYGDVDYCYYKGNSPAESFLILDGVGNMSDIAENFQEAYEKQGWFPACLDITKDEITSWKNLFYENRCRNRE